MALESEELTGSILAAAVAVHRALGPGFLESVYAEALIVEMSERQIEYAREVTLKAIKEIADTHFCVVRSYLRALGLRHGLILNFAKPTLEAKRVLAPEGSLVPAFMPSSAALSPISGSASGVPR